MTTSPITTIPLLSEFPALPKCAHFARRPCADRVNEFLGETSKGGQGRQMQNVGIRIFQVLRSDSFCPPCATATRQDAPCPRLHHYIQPAAKSQLLGGCVVLGIHGLAFVLAIYIYIYIYMHV